MRLEGEIAAGVPIVGLEPSCVSVFRDELCNLLPDDEDAKRLRDQTFVLSEFLERHAPDFELPEAAPQGARPAPLPPRRGARLQGRGEV